MFEPPTSLSYQIVTRIANMCPSGATARIWTLDVIPPVMFGDITLLDRTSSIYPQHPRIHLQ